MAGKHPGGRPRHSSFESPGKLEKKFEEYFAICAQGVELPCVMGMAVFLGCTTDTILEYEGKKEFSSTIKKAKARAYYEKMKLAAAGKMNPTIFIFDAVNNHGMINTRSEARNKSELTGKNGTPLIPADTISVEERALLQGIAKDYARKIITSG